MNKILRPAACGATLALGLAMLAAPPVHARIPASHADHAAHIAASEPKVLPPAPPVAVPGNSVYQLGVKLTDQDGKTFNFAARRGKPAIVSMFYTGCQFVCPMLIETVRLNEEQLTPAEREQVANLLVSFDVKRDTVPVLKETAAKRNVPAPQWTLARGDAGSVRKLAATLGIQYRQLPDGEFNHSTVLVLLDGEGRIVGKTNKMGVADPAFVKLVQDTLHAAK